MTEKRAVFDHATEVWSRLFDHRPFVRGEIKSFVHNLELKYPGQQAPDLTEPLDEVHKIQTTLVDSCKELLAESLPQILEDSSLLQSHCQAVLQGTISKEQVKDRAAELQIQREEELGRFLTELQRLREEVDQEFARKEADVERHYQRAEQKLS